jgi:dTDP-4-amino-4,6-dideoxygalactose transaminase
MRQRGIHAVFHYQPLHLSSMGRRTGWSPDGCPNACQVADRIVRLPFFTSMTADEQDRVIAAAKSFAV